MKGSESRVKDEHLKAIIAKVVDNASVEIPEVMVTERIKAMLNDLSRNLTQQGMTLEQYYQYTNSTPEVMQERMRPQAAESVKTDLVLETVAKAEGIEVTEDEVDVEIKKVSERHGQDAALLKQSLIARGEISFYKQSLISDKTVNFLVEQNT